eukprot:TRINITY_DN6014_c0_g1_i2.p1 TRINITY_DN6014_c0_g1~~TRINITY_DN6014_c0_g1_i2.p1  ORF type:complete len:1565 (+),score=272.96 TRINITY_DN6014_c0_g1_i2:45-4739(+)
MLVLGVLIQLTFLISSVEGGEVKWHWVGEGKTCNAGCEQMGYRCVEDEWVTSESQFKALLSSDSAGSSGLTCDTIISGGFLDSPVRTVNGICSWDGPELTWNAEEPTISDRRCYRSPATNSRRLCPCSTDPFAGIAAWGDDKWILHDQPSKVTVGISSANVLATYFTDTYYVYREDHGTIWLETGNTKYRLKNPSKWYETSNATVVAAASNDVVNFVAYDDGVTYAWKTGEPIQLPYIYTIDRTGGETPAKWLSGPIWHQAYWIKEPDFGDKIPSNIQEKLSSNNVHSAVATRAAFAVLLQNGEIVAWGDEESGGKMPQIDEPAIQLFATRAAFTALLQSGKVVSWGHGLLGGHNPFEHLISNVINVFTTSGAFAALTDSFQLHTWGNKDLGGTMKPENILVRDEYGMCPTNYEVLTTKEECQQAALTENLIVDYIVDTGKVNVPGGCYVDTVSGDYHWNDDPNPDHCVLSEPMHPRYIRPIDATLRMVLENSTQCIQECCSMGHACAACGFLTHSDPRYMPKDGNETVYDYDYDNCFLYTERESSMIMDMTGLVPKYSGIPVKYGQEPYVATNRPSVETYVKNLNISRICAPIASSLNSTAFQQNPSDPIRGVYANKYSFLALKDVGPLIFPYSAEKPIFKGLEDVDVDVSKSVFVSADMFLVPSKDSKYHPVYSVGGPFFWTNELDKQEPIDVEATMYVTAVRTGNTSMAVSQNSTVQNVPLSKSKAFTHVISSRPEAVQMFHEITGVACFWDGVLMANGSVFHLIQDYDVENRRNYSREQCARLCLDTPRCTGFEYPLDGTYCAPWLDGHCTNKTMLETHTAFRNYELFILKSMGEEFNTTEPESYNLIANSNSCDVETNLGETILSEVPITTRQRCESLCTQNPLCQAFDYFEANSSVVNCRLFSRHKTTEGVPPPSPSMDEDPIVPSCWSKAVTIVRNNDIPPEPCTDLSFRFENTNEVFVYPCTFTKYDNGTYRKVIQWERNNPTQKVPIRYQWSTSSGDPADDPVKWRLTITDVVGRKVVVEHQHGTNDPITQHAIDVPRNRNEDLYWMSIPKGSLKEGVALSYTFEVLETRGKFWYHPQMNTFCDVNNYSKWKIEEDYTFVENIHSVADCARLCENLVQNECRSFSYPHNDTVNQCALYFGETCIRDEWRYREKLNVLDRTILWQYRPGTDLYALSLLPRINQIHAIDSYKNQHIYNSYTVPHGKVAATTIAAFAVNNEETRSIEVFGNIADGGNASNLILGQQSYLNTTSPNGVSVVLAGAKSFVLTSYGIDRVECVDLYCTPPLDYDNNQILVPSSAPIDWDFTTAMSTTMPVGVELQFPGNPQLCFDNHPSSWSYDDYKCVCLAIPSFSYGQADPCAPIDSGLSNISWLCIIPAVGCMALILVQVSYRHNEHRRRILGLIEMYLLHASNDERIALNGMLAANKGYETSLLQTLIPGYMERAGEIRLFLLWQLRLEKRKGLKSLPCDLIKTVQAFAFGPTSLRQYRNPPVTPLGSVVTKVMHLGKRANLYGEPCQVVADTAEEEEARNQANAVYYGDEFSQEMTAPLFFKEVSV